MESFKENNRIFNYLYPNSNTILSELSGPDLQYLIVLLEDYLIDYRNNLSLPKIITFGTEIEFEHAKLNTIEKNLKKLYIREDWKSKNEVTVEQGGEINSPPLNDSKKTWNELLKVCKMLQKYSRIDKSAGAHLHVGSQILGNDRDAWLNLIKLWINYEHVLFLFSYGEFSNHRPGMYKYARPIAHKLIKEMKIIERDNYSLEDILKSLSDDFALAINFVYVNVDNCNDYHKMNTIEFRCPNGTLSPIIWQNNINTFTKLLLKAKEGNISDYDLLTSYERGYDDYEELKYYKEIHLDDALKLSDMIFNTNLDKINFLKQYIKSYQEDSDKYEKVKTLTRF